jgi:Tol biopolymer transport system component
VQRLTDHPADEGYPAFSPDGSRISFDSDRDGSFEIYTMDAGGSNLRRLTYNPANDVSASWSPDGTQIAFMSNRTGRFEVWLMNADGSNQRQFTGGAAPSEGTHWFPQFSPEGERLAFHVNRDVYTVAIDGSGYMRLTEDPDNGMVPSWMPSAERIVFMSWRTGATEIWAMGADGSDPHRLTHTEAGESIDPRVSPDGTRIAYTWVPSGGPGPKHIMVMDADGSNVRQLTGSAQPAAGGR